MAKRVESPSSINTFKQCKRKYYHQYIEKLPTLPNIHQVRGNIAHSTLEHFYNIEVSDWTKENFSQKVQLTIQQLFLHQWKAYEKKLKDLHLNPDQEKFYFEETMMMLMNWANHFTGELNERLLKNGTSLPEAFMELTPIREQEFSSDNYSVHGFIDAIKHLEDEVHIIDYKTNSSFEIKDSIKLQLAIYSLLYHEKHGKLPSKVGIFFLRHKLKMINVDEDLLNLAKREVELIHAHTSITEDKQDYPRNITPLCKWSTGKCDFYDTCKPHGEKKR
ncbi:PD-(D/E)XK nuclease family protein [Candidatus Woesearchaeota archaeon]|nr:PD-(D/E)XK nuclease family protein [Candidatus Woesearchaeota archaeon]